MNVLVIKRKNVSIWTGTLFSYRDTRKIAADLCEQIKDDIHTMVAVTVGAIIEEHPKKKLETVASTLP